MVNISLSGAGRRVQRSGNFQPVTGMFKAIFKEFSGGFKVAVKLQGKKCQICDEDASGWHAFVSFLCSCTEFWVQD